MHKSGCAPEQGCLACDQVRLSDGVEPKSALQPEAKVQGPPWMGYLVNIHYPIHEFTSYFHLSLSFSICAGTIVLTSL